MTAPTPAWPDVAGTGCGPVCRPPVVTESGAGRTRARVVVDPSERVFAGHYPGWPILPGVCLVEYVRLTALAGLRGTGDWTLTAIESSRFLRPVRPGDELAVECAWSGDGAVRWCSATVAVDGGTAARVRLRFDAAPPGAGRAVR